MKEIIKITLKINKMETKQTQWINELKIWFFEKINKINKLLEINLQKMEKYSYQAKQN